MAQLLALGAVRFVFGAPGRDGSEGGTDRAESAWLTATIGTLALLELIAISLYLVSPHQLRWSTFQVATPIRWIALLISCLGAAGEVWAAVSLGASYSPLLRVAEEQAVVKNGPYRWIRHPLYAFGLPMMAGWGIATCSWLILATGTVLIVVLAVIRVPREEAMMLAGFGESYREYMLNTGRFLPRLARRLSP